MNPQAFKQLTEPSASSHSSVHKPTLLNASDDEQQSEQTVHKKSPNLGTQGVKRDSQSGRKSLSESFSEKKRKSVPMPDVDIEITKDNSTPVNTRFVSADGALRSKRLAYTHTFFQIQAFFNFEIFVFVPQKQCVRNL